MDAASGIAGLIGLSALIVQSTTKIIGLIKDLREVPVKLQEHLQWLESLIRLIHQFDPTISNFKRIGTSIDPSLLQEFLENGLAAIQRLVDHIESRVRGLENSKGLRRRVNKLQAVLASKVVDAQLHNIRQTLDGLDICLANISLRMQQESQFNSRQTQRELQCSMKQLLQAASTISAGLQDMKSSQQWACALQGALPLEISKIINELLDQKLAAFRPDQSLIVKHPKIQKPRIDQVTPMSRINDVSNQGKESVLQQGKYLQRKTLKEDEVAKAPKSLIAKGHGQLSKMFHDWQIYNRFGYLIVRVCHQFVYNNVEQPTQEMIAYSVRVCPRYRWCSRAMDFHLQYDRTHSLSSPISIQLRFPCVRTESDPIVTAIMSGCLETVQDLIRSGKYRPYDLVDYSGWTRSLLNLAVFNAQFDIVKYLVQQGAKPDCSASSVLSTSADAWHAYQANRKCSMERFYNTIGLLLDAGGEYTADMLIMFSIGASILPNASEFRRVLFYFVHHESSSIMLSDIQNSSKMSWWLWADCISTEAYVGEKSWVEKSQLLLELGYNFGSSSNMISLCEDLGSKILGQRFGSQFLRLYLQNGLDPCGLLVLGGSEITHTHLAYMYNILSAWFEALYDSGISIEAVARHALEHLSGLTSSHIRRNLCRTSFRHLGLDDHFSSFETMRTDLLKAFTEHGCYIDHSEDFTPKKEEKSNATGADFKPLTVYDAERAKLDISKRKTIRVQEIDAED